MVMLNYKLLLSLCAFFLASSAWAIEDSDLQRMSGNAASEVGLSPAVRIEVLATGRLNCPLNPLAGQRGSASQSGRYVAIATYCRQRGARFRVNTVEVLDLETRTAQRLAINNDFAFWGEDQLATFQRGFTGRDDAQDLRLQVYDPPFTGEPESRQLAEPLYFYGYPQHLSVSPQGNLLAIAWPGVLAPAPGWPEQGTGELQVYAVGQFDSELSARFNQANTEWLSDRQGFNVLSMLWVDNDHLAVEAWGLNIPEPNATGGYPAIAVGRAVVEINTRTLSPDQEFAGFTSLDQPFAATADSFFSPEYTHPRDIVGEEMVVYAGGRSTSCDNHYESYCQFQIVSLRNHEEIGVVPLGADHSETTRTRQLRALEFVDNDSFAILIDRAARITVVRASDWQVLSALGASDFRLRDAYRVIPIPNSNELVLFDQQSWAHARISMEHP